MYQTQLGYFKFYYDTPRKNSQFLTQAGGGLPIADDPSKVKEKPKYERKKEKLKLVVAEKLEEVMEAAETDQAEADSSVSQVGEAEEKVEGVKAMEEDDVEWDAKSWDYVDVLLPGISPFKEEEEEEEDKEDEEVDAKPVVRKGAPAMAEPVKKPVAPSVATKKEEMGDNEKKHEEVEKEKEDTSKKSRGSDLRSPICCILGYVDAGKTKLLDCIRRTNVQEGEAGGITNRLELCIFQPRTLGNKLGS